MERHKIDPNFWCSPEYLQFRGARQKAQDGWVWIEGNGFMWFPPVHIFKGMLKDHPWFGFPEIWSDFMGFNSIKSKPKFLDYEYIYYPGRFLHRDGRKWKKFRKNIRKWPKRNNDFSYFEIDHKDQDTKKQIDSVVISWLDNRPKNEMIHDPETIIRYVHQAVNRAILVRNHKEIVGINIWDHSWRYINYRLMICRPEPFLDEWMRYLFYTSPKVLFSGNKMVNDGGTLDQNGLKRFKDSLNPLRVRKVNQWTLTT